MIRDAGFGPRLVREYNELNILRFIKNEGPISRAQLAKKYKISKAAVSEIINDLLQQGYIREMGVGNSTALGGRRPIMIEFNPKSGYAIGIEIKRDHAIIALGDLNANIHQSEQIEFSQGSPLQNVLEKIFLIIDSYQAVRWVKQAKPVGIGVAIPGLINYRTGVIQESDTLKEWQNFPLRDVLENRYNVETIIENDVKTQALGECRFGNGKDRDHVIYLWIGDGLGAGIIINRELYRGISASAGEIGYYEPGWFISDRDEFGLLYTNQKNFGDLLAEAVLLDGARKGLERGLETSMPIHNLSVNQIIHFADKNDPLAVELLREYGTLVGVVCMNLINVLNPELILIGGHELAHSKTLLKFIRKQVKSSALRTPGHAVQIKSATGWATAGIMGAIGLILEDLFYMERLNVARYRDVFGFRRE